MRPELDLLVASARSEAKRWGASSPNLIHLALSVQRRWPNEFGEAFGEGAAGKLRDAAIRNEIVGDENEILAILERADGSEPVARVVHELRQAIPDQMLEVAATDVSAAESSPTTAGPDGSESAAEDGAWSLPQRTARFLEVIEPDSAIQGREHLIDEMIALLGRRTPATPLLIGASGAGRTSLLRALAYRITRPDYSGPLAGATVVRLRPEMVIANDRANVVRQVLEDLDWSVVLAVDDLEVQAGLGGQGGYMELLGVIRSGVTSPAHRLVVTIDQAFAARLEVLDRELAIELVPMDVSTLSRPVLAEFAATASADLAKHHQVVVPEPILELALSPPGSNDSRVHPGLFVERLDGACVRAALREDRTVASADLGLDRSPELRVPDATLFADRMQTRVIGQDDALQAVARRLVLTRAELDLRPERPDGVFLLVGPTGVGKTELAKTVCAELFGDEQRMIRLDMSEYSQDWALSRLIGPQPGYIGFTEPESWLTTRIRKQPETVLLLDEIEKAHPSIWNAFLQVFDAGRLSDSRGAVADFSRVVVMMTSNMGSRSFAAPAMGFAPEASERETTDNRVLDAVRETMAPELINRIDEIVVLSPLSEDAIQRIAQKEIAQILDRLAERGIIARVDDDVVNLLATSGYDPAYGARHLQRNIERLLLQPLAGATERQLSARVEDGAVIWDTEAASVGSTS